MMESATIVAIVVTEDNQVTGDVPVFFARDDDEQKLLAERISKFTQSTVHDTGTGIYVLVQH